MALRKKWEAISLLNADIYAVQECSKADILKIGEKPEFQSFWMGANKNKGLGLVVKKPYQLTDFAETGLEWIGAGKVIGPETFNIFPVWACVSKQDRNLRYIRQVHALIDRLGSELAGQKTILVGDFNSNTIWDNEHRERSHSRAVERLASLGLTSVYHADRDCRHGDELEPTIYFRKSKDAFYHIDYCFVSKDLLERFETLEIGKRKDWIGHSDHMPVAVVFRGATSQCI